MNLYAIIAADPNVSPSLREALSHKALIPVVDEVAAERAKLAAKRRLRVAPGQDVRGMVLLAKARSERSPLLQIGGAA